MEIIYADYGDRPEAVERVCKNCRYHGRHIIDDEPLDQCRVQLFDFATSTIRQLKQDEFLPTIGLEWTCPMWSITPTIKVIDGEIQLGLF